MKRSTLIMFVSIVFVTVSVLLALHFLTPGGKPVIRAKNQPISAQDYSEMTAPTTPPPPPPKPTKPTLHGPATSNDGKAVLWGETNWDGATICIYDGAPGTNKIAETTTNDYSNYEVTVSGLSKGTHTLYATATANGITSDPSNPLKITVDKTLPTVNDAQAIADGNTYYRNDKGIIVLSVHGGTEIEARVWFTRDPSSAKIRFKGNDYPMTKQGGYWTCILNDWTWSRDTYPGVLSFTFGSNTYSQDLLEVTLVDPSGYVYDSTTGERITGAKVVLERKGLSGFSPWAAEEYLQANPLYTDSLGRYGWDTTSGTYRVKVTKKGYKSVTSKEVSVPPAVTDLNIAMEKIGGYSFYFAEGCTREGFDEYLAIQNPGDKDAVVNITYMLGSGENKPQQLTVAKRSRKTVSVNAAVGPNQDVSALVSSNMLIIAERPMYFNYEGKWTGGHDVVGATSPRSTWYLAEGCTREGFKEFICVQNPGNREATVNFTYMLGKGKVKTGQVKVNKKSRATVNVNSAVGEGQDVSTKVESTQPVVVERPMYFAYNNTWTGGHDVVGATGAKTSWYFAEGCTREGFEEWLCLQNPAAGDTKVTITYMLGTGENIKQPLTLKPQSRETVNVNKAVGAGQDLSCTVTSNKPIIVERPMYFNYNGLWDGGHDVPGALYAKSSYFFAEGCTREGFDEYISLQNPGSEPVVVTVTYMLGTGENKTRQVPVAAKSRETVNVVADVGRGQDVSAKVTSKGGSIIAERPMYFNYNLVWTGGSDVVGF